MFSLLNVRRAYLALQRSGSEELGFRVCVGL
jgi:hypothetical protein